MITTVIRNGRISKTRLVRVLIDYLEESTYGFFWQRSQSTSTRRNWRKSWLGMSQTFGHQQAPSVFPSSSPFSSCRRENHFVIGFSFLCKAVVRAKLLTNFIPASILPKSLSDIQHSIRFASQNYMQMFVSKLYDRFFPFIVQIFGFDAALDHKICSSANECI